jgi:hypothetical protein
MAVPAFNNNREAGMWRVLLMLVFAFVFPHSRLFGQYGPQVRITSGGMQSSGVAISETEVLTVGHAFTDGSHVRLEFVGVEHNVIVPGYVVVTDHDRDLGLIRHKLKNVAWLKRQRAKGKSLQIKGFHGLDEPMRVMRGEVIASGAAGSNGEPLLVVDCEAVPGLSGSGVIEGVDDEEFVVGIQSAGSKQTYCATFDQIEVFLSSNRHQSK